MKLMKAYQFSIVMNLLRKYCVYIIFILFLINLDHGDDTNVDHLIAYYTMLVAYLNSKPPIIDTQKRVAQNLSLVVKEH